MMQVLRDAAPILAVLLPAIGAFFAYRRQESRRDQATHRTGAKRVDIHAIGGLLADSSLVERQVAAMELLAQAVGSLAALSKDNQLAVKRLEQFDKIIDEARDIRRALEEISSEARRTRDRPRIPEL